MQISRSLSARARRLRDRSAGRALRALGVQRAAGAYDDRASARTLARLAALRLSNLRSRRRVVGEGAAVVVMTTTSARITLVWAALESIAAGSARPRRLILTLDDPNLRVLPTSLRRLERRGVEIRHTDSGLGVHTKWWPYVAGEAVHSVPVVTSDDDQLYPRDWLAQLLDAARHRPDIVIAHRAHRIHIERSALAPYVQWERASSRTPSFATFGTSVSGQLLPIPLLEALRARGTAFLQRAPRADDIWLHASAVHAGIRVSQVGEASRDFPFVPGTQTSGLYVENVLAGGNDQQFATALDPADLARIIDDAR